MRARSANPDMPPPLELECLKALWSLGEASVGDVRRWVSSRRDLAYTTVMTLLDRLVRRGVASRRKQGRSFLYSPCVSRDTVRNKAVAALVHDHFDGSRNDLVAFLQNGHITPAVTPAPGQDSDDDLDATLL